MTDWQDKDIVVGDHALSVYCSGDLVCIDVKRDNDECGTGRVADGLLFSIKEAEELSLRLHVAICGATEAAHIKEMELEGGTPNA